MNEDILCSMLGFLCNQPMSGYELKKITEETIIHFWTFNFSQIYPALKILHDENAIDKRSEQVGGKKKIIYSITKTGKKRLQLWLEAKHKPEDKKIPFLLKLFFCPKQSKLFSYHCKNYLDENKTRLSFLTLIKKQLEGKKLDVTKSWLETVDFGIYITKAKIAWLKSRL